MSQPSTRPPKFGFVKTFVLPALLIFLVPVLSFVFFRHAQDQFNSQARESLLKEIHADRTIPEAERAKALEFFGRVPFSELLANDQFAANVPADTRFHYATFRWMILLSGVSILAGVGVFLLAGVCVLLSLRSPMAQVVSLSAGWHVLRISAALQAVAQGVLLVALSFWVTALWMNMYSVKLILCAGLVAVVGMVVAIIGIFQRVSNDFGVVGRVIDRGAGGPLWDELGRICDAVGTAPPDQVIVGIDDNFFVTEHPVTVGERVLTGRTLYVSLSMLKQLDGGEADAVLAHEMAHFSGSDTVYSRRISPLLGRYGNYLEALRNGGVTLPIYYYMVCFRALFELSLGRMSRKREFRADRVAAEATSPRDAAGALLRTAAYSRYRGGVEQDLFRQERALESANVRERIEAGFGQYAASFVAGPDIAQLAPPHPFDTHPPLEERLHALGVPLGSAEVPALLANPGDGRWFGLLPDAETLEREMWQGYEDGFRRAHEESLPYRFLPATPEEREIVVRAFPEVSFAGSQGTFTLDHEQMGLDGWPGPVRYAEITGMMLDNDVLQVAYQRKGKSTQKVKMGSFPDRQKVLDAINRYYGRHLAATDYQKHKPADTPTTE